MPVSWPDLDPFSPGLCAGSVEMAVLLTAIMLSPLFFWLYNGWSAKQSEIFASLSRPAKNQYLLAFQNETDSINDADARFDSFYNKWYGRSHYIIPIILLIMVNLLITASLVDTAQSYFFSDQTATGPARAFYRLPVVAAASLAGAYTFVAWDFIARAKRRDMTSHDVISGTLRLAVCVPVGYALAGLAAPALGSIVAFAVGVFPLTTITSILRRFALKQIDKDDAEASAQDQPTRLSGIDRDIAERLWQADVSTIAQLAYCDPIQLTMRTNLSFVFVIDIVSQALAWVYLEDKLNAIRCFGLRGAYEVWDLQKTIDSKAAPDQDKAASILKAATTTTGIDQDAFKNAVQEIAGDPRTVFLVKAYNRIDRV